MVGFAVFGFASQLLLAFFSAYRWRPAWATRVGTLVYGLGLVAVLLAIVLAIEGQPWYPVLGAALYAAWPALGAFIDLVRPISWRQPPRWVVLVPDVALLMAALMALWVPLWYVDRVLWIAFGLLHAGHIALKHHIPRVERHEGSPAHVGGRFGWAPALPVLFTTGPRPNPAS